MAMTTAPRLYEGAQIGHAVCTRLRPLSETPTIPVDICLVLPGFMPMWCSPLYQLLCVGLSQGRALPHTPLAHSDATSLRLS